MQASDSILLRSSVGMVMKAGDAGLSERAMVAAKSILAKSAICDGSYQLVDGPKSQVGSCSVDDLLMNAEVLVEY